MASVIVTGGAGYLGTVLTRRLLDRGHSVTVYDAMYWDTPLIREWISGAKVVEDDIVNFANHCLEADYCCHLAAISNDPTAELDKETTWRVNVEGTRQVAAYCAQRGIQFLFASTASVYGRARVACPLRETDPVNPQSRYAESKLEAENIIRQLALKSEGTFRPVILRQATIYGLSPRMRYDLVVNTFVKDFHLAGKITVHGGGTAWRPHVYVGDVAGVYAALVEGRARLPEPTASPVVTLNVARFSCTIADLAEMMAHTLSRRSVCQVEILAEEPADPRSYALSTEAMTRAGLECPTSIPDAVEELESEIEAGYFTDFDNPAYYNHRYTTEVLVPTGRI